MHLLYIIYEKLSNKTALELLGHKISFAIIEED